MTTYTLGHDANGNKVCKIRIQGARGFSIQTNGNLPRTHRDGIRPQVTENEINEYVRAHGSARQREILNLK